LFGGKQQYLIINIVQMISTQTHLIMKTKSILLFSILLILLASCNRPACKNDNPIFDKFSPSSQEYKTELANQLKAIDPKELSYWLKEYEEVNGQEYLKFYIQSDNLCAIIVLTMQHWDDKLEHVRAAKGKSYQGEEFTNLKFDVLQDSLKTEFIYKSFVNIID
jgi:hypothetical protein